MMNGTFGKSTAKDVGDWGNNKEMNPASNSSIVEDSIAGSEEESKAEGWRDDNFGNSDKGVSAGSVSVHESERHTKSGDPGRTPGKAEGVEDAEERGNE
jgi:hypothetical protein